MTAITPPPYNPIKIQNQSLQTFVSNLTDYYSLERNQFVRKSDTLPILGYIQKGLLFLYAIVYVVFIIVLFVSGKKISVYMKIVLVVLFTLYPFFIYAVENAIYQIYYYVYSVLYGESYHTITAQKGLQNPKNFKDITNLSYNMNSVVEKTSPFVAIMQDQLQGLPDNIKRGFTEFQKILPSLSSETQNLLVKLQQEWVDIYNQTQTQLASANSSEIQTITNQFVTTIRLKLAKFWADIKNLNLSVDTVAVLDSTISNMKSIFNIS